MGLLLMVGCVSTRTTPLEPSANEVSMGTAVPSADCTQVGPVNGYEYGFKPGDLLVGAVGVARVESGEGQSNIMRNRAAQQGANYVQLTVGNATGIAFRCPKS